MTLSIDTYFCKHLWILVGLLRLLGKCLAPSAVVSDSKGLCSSLKTKTMAIVLTCHLIETIWSKRDTGMRAPYIVIDHNGQQHQTDVMKAGAVTVWNTKATFPYAPTSDLVVMAFEAAGRQPGSFIAQAVVDVAAMLQQGSLNASAQMVDRKGRSVGVVLFDVGLVTSSKALAAGLGIPSLTYSTQPCPDSPTAALRSSSPNPAAATGRNSPFAQLAVQRGLAQPGTEAAQPTTPGTAQSMGSKLVGSISQALVGALLGLETRDRDEDAGQQADGVKASTSSSPSRARMLSSSLDCSPTGRAPSGMDASHRAAAQKATAGTAVGGSTRSRRSSRQQASPDAGQQRASRSSALTRSASSIPTAPMAATGSAAALRASTNSPLTAARHTAVSAAGVAAPAEYQLTRMAASANGHVGRGTSSNSEGLAANAQGAPVRSNSSSSNRALAQRPSHLIVPAADAAVTHSPGTASPQLGNQTLSPLTEARNRLRLARNPPLPPLSQLFPQPQREGLIPVGRAPLSPGGYSQCNTEMSYSQGVCTPYSGDHHDEALMREFEAADAAGKEKILFRELMAHQDRNAGSSSHLLMNLTTQQHRQQILEHQHLMNALEGMNSNSPVTTPARGTADAFRSCFSSSTQITSGSSSNGCLTDRSTKDTPFKNYPNLPEFSAPAAAARAAGSAAGAKRGQSKYTKARMSSSSSTAAAVAARSPTRPAAGGLLQQLSSAESGGPLTAARQGHKLLGDKVGQQGSAASTPMSQGAAEAAAAEAAVAAARELNWQLFERMTQQEVAAAAAAQRAVTPVESYAISHAETEFSDAATEADTNPDAGEEAAAAAAAAAAAHSKPQRQPPAQPAYTCRKSPGQLGSYKAASSSSNDQAAARQPSKRWGVAVPKDVLPYPKPQPAFPFVAVAVEPSAPLMPEEYPCA